MRWLAALAALMALPASAQAPDNAHVSYAAALDGATRDLCGRQVALLGEGSTHGDGATLAFKAELVRRLVTRCGYRALFFEASHYDFIAFNRAMRRGSATPDMLSSAIGGLWRYDQEVASLVPFLFARARNRRLTLGGIDYNLGSAGAFYSLDAMPEELSGYLPGDRRVACRESMRRRIMWDYGERAYTAAEKGDLQACLVAVRDRARGNAEIVEMVDNFQRLIETDFTAADTNAARDFAMYHNFEWLMRRLQRGTKVIVWGATVHMAKRPVTAEGTRAFGSYVHGAYARRVFAIGFSAGAGEYRVTRRAGNRTVPSPVTGSIEAVALDGTAAAAVYFGPRQLASFGNSLAAPLQHAFILARWDEILDALVIFRAERPPRAVAP